MVKKFPLLRGKGRNKSIKMKPFVLNVESLNVFSNDDTVSRETLLKKGLIKDKGFAVKILGNGKLERKLTVNLPVSESAKKAIEKAGGKVTI